MTFGQGEFDLDPLLEIRALNRKEIEERFGISDADVAKGVRYEAMAGLDCVSNEESQPATFYFRGDDLVMMYIDGQGFEGDCTDAIVAKLGKPVADLSSRAGKASTLHVYPDQGLAFSASGQEVEFIEVFPPTTLERYEREIYQDPGPFIR